MNINDLEISSRSHVTDQQFLDFVKKNKSEQLDDPLSIEPITLYYLNLFRKHGQKFFLSWNWATFFSGGWQLCYRKLYLLTIVSCVVEFTLNYLLTEKIFVYNKASSASPKHQTLEFLVLIIPSFLTALVGNWLYLRHARNCIKKNQIHKKGVSGKAVIIGLTLAALCNFMIEYFFLTKS